MIPVLFVDDEMIVRVALKSMVDWEKTEFEIVGAVADGEAALQYIEKYHPGIIVTDLKMPHLDGIGLAKELYEREYPGEIIILTSFGEFELAREALRYGVTDYLLKANFTDKELLEALRKAARKLPEDRRPSPKNEPSQSEFDQPRIYRMLYGTEEEKPENPAFDRAYSGRFAALYVFKKELLLAGRTHTARQNEPDLTSKEMLSSLISETFDTGTGMKVIPLTPVDALIVVPLSSGNPAEELLGKYLSRIQNSVKIYMNTEVGFVLSEPFSNEGELCANLKDCAKAAPVSFYKGFGSLIYQNDGGLYRNEVTQDQEDAIELICAGIAFREYEEAEILTVSILESFDRQKIHPACACDYIRKLLRNILIFGSGEDGGKEKRLAADSGECATVFEFESAVTQLIRTVKDNAESGRTGKYRKDVVRIIEYIRENITQKITLAQIAKLVNMNESYISRLFKNETGVNLTAYINLLKMGKAIELLKDPNVMVKEAANKLGFDEQSYFNRIFNKYLSSSPSEFKKRYKKSIKVGQNSIKDSEK
ncbi:response regulator transcription factor [Caproiciproducens faecalis]|uniref:Stage 0 sporulation protein A homolog n=1 Tax=Caproiciproducens faecalis TaxID=2820301 RepID=A0ABS7DN67_9FIRM|nr:response regulator [Caproiciproducens faecalis]MBW7572663.1 response regulator [Caproiciproducens faecalis]